MIIIRKRTISLVVLALLFLTGFWSAYLVRRSQIKIGDHYLRLNPFAQIDPKKEYTIKLWDYDLPIHSEGKSYEQYLKQMLAEFRKEHPNIHVELKLLDLLEGDEQLQQALARNTAPDVYCSFYTAPEYYFRRQIPVGPFLRKKEVMTYQRAVSDLYAIDQILCSYPRWASVDIWVGNRGLLEAAGLDIHKIQNQGWDWDELLRLGSNMTKNVKLMVGVPVNRGYAAYLNQSKSSRRRSAVANMIALQGMIQTKQKAINLERDSLAEFSQGHSLLLSGVRPIVYLFLKEASSQGKLSGVDPVILPAPRLIPGIEVQFVESGVVNVYRNRYVKGDDHLMAAIRLGRFISTYHDVTPWSRLGVFPTGVQAKGSSETDSVLNQLLQRSVLYRQSGSEKSGAIIARFLNGAMTADEFQRSMAVGK